MRCIFFDSHLTRSSPISPLFSWSAPIVDNKEPMTGIQNSDLSSTLPPIQPPDAEMPATQTSTTQAILLPPAPEPPMSLVSHPLLSPAPSNGNVIPWTYPTAACRVTQNSQHFQIPSLVNPTSAWFGSPSIFHHQLLAHNGIQDL